MNDASLKRTEHWRDGVLLAHYNLILLHWCCSFLVVVACAGHFLRDAAWGRMHFCSNIRNLNAEGQTGRGDNISLTTVRSLDVLWTVRSGSVFEKNGD